MDKELIELRKRFSKIIIDSKNQAKRGQCLWCGKKITRFCNSHSVPQCVLKNIDTDGKLDYFNSIVQMPFIKLDKGIKEAGTFKLLCQECDGKIFQEYENVDMLEAKPTLQMLNEIAMKNDLLMLNKRYFEIELYNNLERQNKSLYPFNQKQEVNGLDERDFWLDYIRVKEMINGNLSGSYKLFYWRKLNYLIPMAFQGLITLYGDLEGNIVTDIFNTSETIEVKHMHVCCFPLKSNSVVFAFYHEKDKEYVDFAEQFARLGDKDKLSLISYIIFLYSEDMLFAKKFPHKTWFMNEVLGTFGDTTEMLTLSQFGAELFKNYKLTQLKKWDKNFPCILSEKFAVKE